MSHPDTPWRPNAAQMHALDILRANDGRAHIGNTTGYRDNRPTVARRTVATLADHGLVELDICCGVAELIEGGDDA